MIKKNLLPLYGKIFTDNLVIYCFEPQSQMIYYGLFLDFFKQCRGSCLMGKEVENLVSGSLQDVGMLFQLGWGERNDQSESAACPPRPLSHAIDMAFGD
jgi:hypothetical protein